MLRVMIPWREKWDRMRRGLLRRERGEKRRKKGEWTSGEKESLTGEGEETLVVQEEEGVDG